MLALEQASAKILVVVAAAVLSAEVFGLTMQLVVKFDAELVVKFDPVIKFGFFV